MDNRFILNVDTSTKNELSPFEQVESKTITCTAADIAVGCAICEEYTSMNSHNRRAYSTFICDKCKAAIKHVRDYLENGGNLL